MDENSVGKSHPLSDSPELGTTILDAALQMLRSKGPSGILPVEGTSMMPFLRPGMRVLIDFAPRQLRRGDVVLFRQGPHAVVHRMVARTSDGVRARGDNRANLDPPVRVDDVLGRVVSVGDGDDWRDLRRSGARTYGFLLALHNLAWSGASVVASWIDKRLARIGIRNAAFRIVRGLDALNMRLAHRLLFRLVHRRVPPPDSSATSPKS